MARTVLPITSIPADYAGAGVAVTFTAADVANGNSIAATGREIVIAKNTDSGAHTVTIASSADQAGRTKDITAESIAAGASHVFEQFPLLGYKQTDGTLHINANDATVLIAVLRLPN